MSGGAVCPACGVAVVPGYVRCPKCHKPLPAPARRGGPAAEGGTAVASRGPVPMIAVIAIGVVAVALVAYLGLRGKHAPSAATPGSQAEAPPTEATGPASPPPSEATPDDTKAPAGPTADAVAKGLERTLKKQHLWSTVDIVGGHVDIRSGSCGDPAMGPAVESSQAAFKAAGLTRMRCLEQSGHVVFERNL